MSGASPTNRPYEGVALCAPVTVPYARTSIKGPHWWIGRALSALVRVAGIEKGDIDGLAVASYSISPVDAVGLSEYFGLELRTLDVLPMGGASGIIAARRAARAVQAGDAEIVACVAGDTLGGGDFAELVRHFSDSSRDAVFPYGAGGPNQVFALITRAYMDAFGATRADFGRIALAQRTHAAANPMALLRSPLTLEAYLAARPIAVPLHLYDCVMPCCGAEGFLVMEDDRARRLGVPFARMKAALERHNAGATDTVQLSGRWAAEAAMLYETAGLGPDEMDFLQAYDDYPVIVMLQLEDLAFCGKGDASRFVHETSLTIEETTAKSGRALPLNTCGGQLSAGQAGAAGGFLGMVEGLRQLTSHTLGRAVPDATTGMVSGYGTVNYDRGLCATAAILTAGETP